jgi:peptidoglycan hydrolase CwlO-like protein
MTSKKVYTNTSANPVFLSDGSSVGVGEQTTDAQYELAKGSFWEQHGVLVTGAPDKADEGGADYSALIRTLQDENQHYKDKLFAEQSSRQKLETDLKDLPGQLKTAQDKLTEEQARSQKLETDLKAALAKK